jgi:hypothetical protein
MMEKRPWAVLSLTARQDSGYRPSAGIEQSDYAGGTDEWNDGRTQMQLAVKINF